MKSKLLLCVAVIALVGCASDQNSAPEYRDLDFSTDLLPAPVEGLTAADVDLVSGTPVASPSRSGGQHN